MNATQPTDDPLISRAETDELTRQHGPNYVAWEYYSRWLSRYRDENPDDMRDDLELIDVFASETHRMYPVIPLPILP